MFRLPVVEMVMAAAVAGMMVMEAMAEMEAEAMEVTEMTRTQALLLPHLHQHRLLHQQHLHLQGSRKLPVVKDMAAMEMVMAAAGQKQRMTAVPEAGGRGKPEKQKYRICWQRQKP